jgi:hypothetical protein
MQWILKKILGTKNERDIKLMRPLVTRINELEQAYQSLTEDALKAKTLEFRDRLAQGQTLDDPWWKPSRWSRTPAAACAARMSLVCGHERYAGRWCPSTCS